VSSAFFSNNKGKKLSRDVDAAVEGHSQWLGEGFDGTFVPVINSDGTRRPSTFKKFIQGEQRMIVFKVKRRKDTSGSEPEDEASTDPATRRDRWYPPLEEIVVPTQGRWEIEESS
jgi:hypothetical protein